MSEWWKIWANGLSNEGRSPKLGHRMAAGGCCSFGGGTVVQFPRIWMSSGECRFNTNPRFGVDCMSRFERFERKFPLPEGVESTVLALLQTSAYPDGAFPEGVINSVYFDSLDLESYHDALNGDYRKQKIRLRWYGQPVGRDAISIFLEVKRKEGAFSDKIRNQSAVKGSNLSDDSLLETVESLQIAKRLEDLGVHPASWHRPVIQVCYHRYRFVDPYDQTPLSLDIAIRSRLLDQVLAPSPGWVQLRNAVVEIKGQEPGLPHCLRAARRYMPIWASYSKYARCLTAHLEKPGESGWLKVV